MQQPIGERVREIAAKAAAEMGTEFVHAEIAGSKRTPVVRVYIDKPEGVTIEDCTNVSREMEAVLDADDLIPSAYVLEVSSPGLERELYSLKDFERFTGSAAKVKTTEPFGGQSNFNGVIMSVDGEEIVFEDRNAGSVRFPYSAVSKANLKFDLGQELKKR